ncbi:MAG: ABC transporter ATP-binding protein [Armatimonadota bacterium]
MTPRIAVEDVVIERPVPREGRLQSLRVLSGVNFAVSPGGRLALFGPSGAGKTSLLRLLNRLDDPAQGRVLLDGIDLHQLDPVSVRRRVGMVFQTSILFDLTVEENIAYPLRLQQRELAEDRAAALLEEFDLPAEYLTRKGSQLSGGEQQRVAIARTLAAEPDVLLLDEPSSALDEHSAEAMMDALLRRNDVDRLTIIMITHAREMLLRLACPTLVVHDGRVDSFPDGETALTAANREQVKME